MSARREPSTPPGIPGYDVVRLLGMGGFADVFLYEQQMPRRAVAVKVLLAAHLSDEVRARFRAEAGLMAQLSHHPSIVTIHHADVAPDGRPFLVMEYCSRPGLGQRYRTERMGVAEVLRIGVRLASAVETAHRAGILHRDIKPANVLITDFGWPALTDFGVAATTGLASGAATGMSIPWSPPEMLAEEPFGDERSDVYALAATVYSLLARRSPHEVPGSSNTAADLIGRIERSPLAPTGRGDVPDGLEAVLARAMDPAPWRRHPSALAFARALQQVEAELLLPMTTLDLPEDLDAPAGAPVAPLGAPVDDQATRLRPVQVVHPDAAPDDAAPSAPRAGAEQPALDDVPDTWRRHAQEVAAAAPEPTRERRTRRTVAAALGGAVVVAAVVVAAVLTLGQDAAPPAADPGPTAPTVPEDPVLAVPAPTDLDGVLVDEETARFTWTNPDPREGDQYLWGPATAGSRTELTVVEDPSVSVPVVSGEPTCIQVAIIREDRRFSTDPAVACAE